MYSPNQMLSLWRRKYLHNPPHSTNLSPSLPTPLHHITTIKYVRFVGYNCSFFVTPRAGPFSHKIEQTICPCIFWGFYKGSGQLSPPQRLHGLPSRHTGIN
jgi:hypothetical protein